MKNFLTVALAAGVLALGLAGCKDEAKDNQQQAAAKPAQTQQLKNVTLGVSIYAGWMPHYYANETAIYKKWGEKYGYNITVKYMDYVPSIEAYTAGQVDAVVMTNMEALDMPAAAGVDTSIVIMGDYSNGNDAVLTRNGLKCADLKGKKVNLVEKTVSHYLLVSALETCGLKESDVTIVNVSDADIAPAFLSNPSQEVVVTWNPMVLSIEKSPGVKRIYDSSNIPGEVQDVLAVNTNVLNSNPDFARALTGAWYEVMGTMNQRGAAADAAMEHMAKSGGSSLAEFKAQLRTTAMFYTSTEALNYTNSDDLKAKMDKVRKFCFEHQLLGENAKSVDVVGVSYPDGTVAGDKGNIKLRYNSTFMAEHAAGKITLTK